jgi:hypothetical protein
MGTLSGHLYVRPRIDAALDVVAALTLNLISTARSTTSGYVAHHTLPRTAGDLATGSIDAAGDAAP